MSKENYNYKEILLGLKKECEEINQKLEVLKNATKVEDKDIEEYYYWIHRWMKEVNASLLCEVTKPFKVWKNHKNQINGIMIEENNNYQFNKPIGLYIDSSKQEEFNETAKELMSSDYVKNTYTPYIQGRDNNIFHTMQVTPSIIRSSIFRGLEGNLTYQYNLVKDELNLLHYPYRITKDMIQELFELQYPKEAFPEYLQQVIEKGKDKEIVITNIKKNKTALQLQVSEDQNKLYIKTKN